MSDSEFSAPSDLSDSDRGDNGAPARTKKSYKCSFEGCRAVFVRPSKLMCHQRKHTGERPFACDEPNCDKTYTNSSHLRRHKKVSHGSPESSETFLCEHKGCGMMLSNKYSLKKHYSRKHNPDREFPFKCAECSKGFKKRRQLQAHMFEHTGEPPFSCTVDGCLKKFTTSTGLNKHVKHHRTHQCRCGVKFELWSAFLTHRKSCVGSTTRRMCTYCGKTFSNWSYCNQHEATHLDQNKRLVYTCPYTDCDRFYLFKNNLKHHINQLHKKIGEGQFPCNFPGCGVIFKRDLYRRRHIVAFHTKKTKDKVRAVRHDKGQVKTCMAAYLSGFEVSEDVHKTLIDKDRTPMPSCTNTDQ